MDTDFFKYPTMTVAKKREEHIKRTLEWANNEYLSGGEAPDVEMEDVAQEAPETFKRASFMTGGSSSQPNDEFSFMKKRVRVNPVDKHVKEYQLDDEERDAKKQKGKKKY